MAVKAGLGLGERKGGNVMTGRTCGVAGALWLAMCWAATPVAFAQGTAPDAGAITEQQRQQLENFRLQKRLEGERPRDPEIDTPGREPTDPDKLSNEKVIKVNRFELDASRILSDEELGAILEPHEGQVISVRDLFDIVAAINRLYDEKRYPTARAILPPQEVKDGVIRIRLIEAVVGDVKVAPTQRLREGYVQERFETESDSILSVDRLEKQLVRFNRLNESQLRAQLAPGSEFGATDILLAVEEPKAVEVIGFVDNAGRESTGRVRGGGILRVPNLTGNSDPLLISGDASEGAMSIYATYSIPFTTHDTRFELAFNYGDIEVIDGPFTVLDVTGDSYDVRLGIVQPFWVTPTGEWAAFFRINIRENRSLFDDVVQSDQDLRIISFGFNAEQVDPRGVWFTEHTLNVGISALGGDEGFVYYDGSATRLQRITDALTLVVRGRLQLSPDDLLPASQQIQVGGSYTVRGWSEGVLTGDNGYYVSFELRHPIVGPGGLFPEVERDRVDAFIFLDHGGAFPLKGRSESISGDDFLTGAGFGVNFELIDRVTGRVSVGFPLDKNPNEPDRQVPWVHFSIQIRAF